MALIPGEVAGLPPEQHTFYILQHSIATSQSADLDMVSPSSVMLHGVRTFEHMDWREVSDKIIAVLTRTMPQQHVTFVGHMRRDAYWPYFRHCIMPRSAGVISQGAVC